MTGRLIAVDLGPLSLSLLDGVAPSVPANSGPCSDDVQRLQALIRSDDALSGESGFEPPDETDIGIASSRTSPITDKSGDGVGVGTLDEVRIELLAFELSAAFQAALPMQAGASTSVRLALRPIVLRDAELSVADCDGLLEFSLWVGNRDDCEWLVLQLPSLARILGERVQRRIHLYLFESVHQPLLLAEQAWPMEATD